MGEMSGLWEGIILSLLFVVLLGSALTYFNNQYDKDYTTGLDTSGLDSFSSATSAADSETGGEVSQTSEGLTLASSWNMGKGIYTTLKSFITGSWINTLTSILGVPPIVGDVARILFLGLLIFAIIKLFFKVAA